MLIPELLAFIPLALLLLRIMIGLVFLSSGWSHVTKPKDRAKSIGMPPFLTLGLGVWEVLGALSIILGLFTQIGAAMLIIVMIGAIYKKIFVWKTGFWGGKSNGWYYDLLYLVSNLVILTTAGGSLTLL